VRWATVLSAPEAKGKGMIACHLLATTTMSAPDIRTALTAMQPDARATTPLPHRMSGEHVQPPAPNAPPAPTNAAGNVTSEAVLAAAARVRGETAK
jgi:hypothetical protein